MKKSVVWKILLFAGICPFISPFVMGAYTLSVESRRSWGDWLIMYSFVYWPSYIVGAAAAGLAAYKLRKL